MYSCVGMDEYLDYVDDADSVLDRLESWDYDDVTEILEASEEARVERLNEELERIEEQLEHRNEIHEEIVDELEWKIDRYTDRLEKMCSLGTGRKDGKRERVKDQILEFYDMLRQEKRKHWQDKQQLEQERREILHELEETEGVEWDLIRS